MEAPPPPPPPPYPHGVFAAAATAPPPLPPTRVQPVYVPDGRGSAAAADRACALEKAMMGFAERKTEVVVNPTVGTRFDSLDEAYDFYNIHSWESGFGIRYGKSKVDDQGRKSMQELLCVCAGRPTKENGSSARCKCTALIRLLVTEDGGWYVCEHRARHTHNLIQTCEENSAWSSHTRIDKVTKNLIRQLRGKENNVDLGEMYISIGSLFGRTESAVPCTNNISEIVAKGTQSYDFRKTLHTFCKIKAEDPEFVYTVQVDDDCRVKTLLWTNGQSRLQYEWFGDAITFDTTYRPSLHGMTFGIFFGIDNNFKTIVLAGVLMMDKKIDSFKWVFSALVELMDGKHPQTIVTDQCQAMEDAILEVLPSTTHRWCKWHVLHKANEFLAPHYTESFQTEFHRILDDMLTTGEFEIAWEMLLEKYGLENHPFLTQIYKMRHKWAKPYFSDIFCAKQTSTQKSETAERLLAEYVPTDCSMDLFVKQYEELQAKLNIERVLQRKRTTIDEIVLRTNLPIEKHASEVYTRMVYEMFRKTLCESEFYEVEVLIPNLRYIARRHKFETWDKWCMVQHEVNVAEDGGAFMCVCKQFEHTGMLCCHAVKVMIHLGMLEIPRFHIMPRWTPKLCWKHRGPPETDTCSACRKYVLYDRLLGLLDRCYGKPQLVELLITQCDELKQTLSTMGASSGPRS